MGPIGMILLAGGLILAGIVAGILGMVIRASGRKLMTKGTCCQGTVIAMPARSGKIETKELVVEFHAAGQTREIRSHTASKSWPYQVGDPITVYYHPDNPDDCLLEADSQRFVVGCLVGAVMFVGAGAFLLLGAVL